jgi:DNA-binding SARP family transcriptional activator
MNSKAVGMPRARPGRPGIARDGGRGLRFRVLGPVEALQGGQPVALGGTTLALLAGLLISANHRVSAETLARLTWDAEPPANPRAALQSGIARLRRALGADVVETVSGGYRVCAGPGELDLLDFSSLVAAAEAQVADGGTERGLSLLDDALGLWQQPVLENVSSDVLRRDAGASLTERYLDAHELRAELGLRLGRHQALAGELSELARAFPFRERLAGSLMVALCRSGRPADALSAYAALRRGLGDELGIDPSAELQDLHVRILRADPAVHGAGQGGGTARLRAVGTARPAAPRPLPAPRQLPPDIADFTGRERELSEVLSLLTAVRAAPAGPPVAVLAGPAGVGKTALALHAAHRASPAYPDGQLYVNLAGSGACPAEPGEVLAELLRAFGTAEQAIPAGLAERAARYRSVVADRRVLVLLDNAGDERHVRDLLPGGPGCGVIVTARARITGLPGLRPVQLGILDDGAAVRLLGRVAGAGRVSAEPAQALALARLCGGLPLALRIVGARLSARPHWPLSRLADRLADPRTRLSELSHGDLDLRAALTLSYQGLPSAAARELLRCIGLMDAPDFCSSAAAALLHADISVTEELLDVLADAQLLEAVRHGAAGQSRYRCHGLIRDFGRELAAAGELAARRRDAPAALADRDGAPRRDLGLVAWSR